MAAAAAARRAQRANPTRELFGSGPAFESTLSKLRSQGVTIGVSSECAMASALIAEMFTDINRPLSWMVNGYPTTGPGAAARPAEEGQPSRDEPPSAEAVP